LRPGVSITTLYEDAEANLWVGRWPMACSAGCRRRTAWCSTAIRSAIRTAWRTTRSPLYRDRVGTFWVGTWNDGVSRVDMGSGGFARIVRQADQPNSLSDNKIRASSPDAGQLWLGSSGGLNLYDPVSGDGKVWRHNPRVPTASATTR
jgi:ligand-binding sensor domain-containing protein